MPVLINSNHWCVAIANVEHKIFEFIDPYGSIAFKTEKYLKIFLRFLSFHNSINKTQQVSHNNWYIKVSEHVKQIDSFNCGVYILYFIDKIIKRESLSEDCCINKHRISIQRSLLEKSLPMHNRCLCCANEVSSLLNTFNCMVCKRIIHEKCLKMHNETEDSNNNGLCNLCLLY